MTTRVICAWCKKLAYEYEGEDMTSHGICLKCAEKHFPEEYEQFKARARSAGLTPAQFLSSFLKGRVEWQRLAPSGVSASEIDRETQ